ncbi:hypothetical protein [Streptomyces sp.]|uniref:hypothetical protein n=1 Tax=Streptomyces sp. TaxID=1931 RepID=UPI002F3E7455
MSTEPDDPQVIARMRNAHSRACTALESHPEPGSIEVWGWRGRTLSQPVTARGGPAWLRIGSAPTGQVNATFWDGSIAAEHALPRSIPRPRLRLVHDWSDEQWEYRAELYDREAALPISTSPALITAPDLSSDWWASVRAALDDVAQVPTSRMSVHQPFLERAMPEYLGTPIDTAAPSWSTAHGDFHWANLSAPELRVFDWEGWGQAPTGYDAAVLHSYSLKFPSIAAQIRRELDVLDTPAGWHAELAVITQLLHSTIRGDNLELAEPLRQRAEVLLGRAVPRPGESSERSSHGSE